MSQNRDVFDVLAEDHETVRKLLVELEQPLETEPEELAAAAERLVMEESRHEAVEEMHFWPFVKERVEGGQELTGHALEQEAEGKRILDKLRKASPGDREFGELVSAFAAAARAHIALEEVDVWPKLRLEMSADEARSLGSMVESAKKTAPTRPHPHAPSSEAAQRSTGPLAGMMDKARDKMTGRG